MSTSRLMGLHIEPSLLSAMVRLVEKGSDPRAVVRALQAIKANRGS